MSHGVRWGIGRVEMALPASAQIYRTEKKKKLFRKVKEESSISNISQ